MFIDYYNQTRERQQVEFASAGTRFRILNIMDLSPPSNFVSVSFSVSLFLYICPHEAGNLDTITIPGSMSSKLQNQRTYNSYWKDPWDKPVDYG
jgi:hypothetical protein